MRAVLVGHLEAIWASWCDCTRHRLIKTRREPTKSGIIGILCLICDRPFTDDAFVAKAASCEYVFRTDREGAIITDFQATRGVMRAKGKLEENSFIATHEYLVLAAHQVAIGGELEFLRELEWAFKFPMHPFGLGKKNCTPTRRIWTPGCLVTTGETPVEVLARWPWHPPLGSEPRPLRLRITTDLGVGSTDGELRHDYPISLNPENRKHADRRVGTVWVPIPKKNAPNETPAPEVIQTGGHVAAAATI